MIAYSTRNRPKVLEYSLSKTREVYDGFIIVVDDNSETREANEAICKKYDCAYLYNEKRIGIPRTKERGFRSLLSFDYQYWLDDDCFLKPGWMEKVQEAQEYYPHLLHLREWAHIKEIPFLLNGEPVKIGRVRQFTGATAPFMAFTKDLYPKMKGFQAGFGIYGEWHAALSLKLASGYFALKDSPKYIHSFDIDGIPEDFDYHFQSSLPMEERKHAQVR